MLEAAAKSLRTAQLDAVADDVVYRRGGESIELKAVPGRTVFRTTDDSGAYVRTETRDFIVPAGSLAFEPEPGDEIVFSGMVYEVLAPGGESVWRWSDRYRTALRIHTKEIGESK